MSFNDDPRDALEWFYRTALRAIPEARRARHHRRHRRIAWENGDPSYFKRRDRLAREAGYRSFWHQRTERSKVDG